MAVPLSSRAGSRDDNFNLIRFLAAAAVLLSHSFPLSGTPGEPLERLVGFSLGHLAVNVFFVLSGFLVTASLDQQRDLRAFLLARVLRVHPVLIAVAVLSAFVLGPLNTELPLGRYLAHPETRDYVLQNTLLAPLGMRFSLPGVFAHVPVHDVVNGSLWTLPWELTMYGLLAALGAVAFAVRRARGVDPLRGLLIGVAVLATVAFLANEALSFTRVPRLLFAIRFTALFFAGSVYYGLREHVWLSWRAFGLMAVLLAVAMLRTAWFEGVLLLTLPYMVLVLAYLPGGFLRGFNALGDYSYGLYAYAFPVQQCIVARLPGIAMPRLFALAFPATLLLAVVSWYAMEKPILGLKKRFARTPRTPNPSSGGAA